MQLAQKIIGIVEREAPCRSAATGHARKRIVRLSITELYGYCEFPQLLEAYADECALPELGVTNPQRQMYEAMEGSGSLQAFGVFDGDNLVGFVTLLSYTLPHYGKKIATAESIYVLPNHRTGAVGQELLAYLETFAKSMECQVLLYSAPADSRFEHFLSHKKEYRRSNSVFIRRL